MGFDQRTAIVTGASGGIGRATVRRLLQDGAAVMLAGLHLDRLDATRADLGKEFDPARMATIACDVSCEDQVIAAVDATIGQFGGWDYVVNNAGTMLFKPIEEQTEQDWRGILDVDLLGAFFFTKQAFLRMRRGGAIVNVSSVHAVETEPLVAPYAAAKAALLSLTRSAALEGKAKGIRVNAVLPGAVDTPMLWDNPNVKAGVEVIDKADVGAPEDLAAAIAFLLTDEARFVDGASLRVDGARLARL
ncbi:MULTISPECIES: SDR family NAD(P)-dependent oxidoreductase [Massilia]|jgi:NAD(P)-dependent dehydrogenase (short-subunit alcohol dehydrogenase family)|uniref:SDR family oxidoreductase n=2 Tax=Massilia TaxID=149698 RepID=A0A7X3FXI5_9BURK|nr:MULTISPECIES: SDR family NAD(P)-dependent oxidoreductase [Telluria group]KQY16171.1 oxidoreductase [Massilia sp. Root133]KQZ45363.1 oxidoreductase [Massilia sp. Root1485]MDN4042555.1 SDR family NAD(P)-dependent oxidoreductase [Massilia sp. YIM B02787]MVW59783.1 SDR family oxidoreductase [Telluria cellulosilytica]